ncbi:MAG: DUF4405 domain-containing protein [Clostridium sp.]|nr:DUF4405 domain-containing protein [Clostridium sp.]
MKSKMIIKICIDTLMTILLLLLMSYQITGQKLHEWLGLGMLLLFIFHNILNFKWYRNLFKGRYKPLRILQTILNFSVLISMLYLGFSGMTMTHYVFDAFDFGSISEARKIHLSASYWGFVLMSVHLGFHWSMVLGIFRKLCKVKKMPFVLIWLMRLTAVLIAGYGAVCFHKNDIVSYMFLRNQFVFFDFEQGAVSVLARYIAMMGFWLFIGFYLSKGMMKISSLKAKRCMNTQ